MPKEAEQAVGAALVVAGVATGVGILAGTAKAATFLGMSGTTAFFAQQFATSFALTAVSSALNKQPSFPGLDVQAAGRTNFFKQPISNRAIIYGQVRTSGPLLYAESTDDEQYLHLVIGLAGHEVEEIGDIYFNDQILTLNQTGTDGNGIAQYETTSPDRYDGLVRIKKHLGGASQAADEDLVTDSDSLWTINHRLQGIAYLYVRLKFDADAFPSGIPSISVVVKGKKIYDPRTETTAWTQNAALIIRDYLTDTDYGLAATADEINDTAFTDAANLCDESVSLAAGGTESRYLANGVIDSGVAPKANLQQMLTSCLGTLYYSGGKWALKAAGYTAAVASFTNDDLRGGIDLITRQSRRDNFNGVKGVFISPDSNWQPTDYPPVTSSTFETVDGGEQTLLDLELPFTTSVATAQRLAKVMLGRQRQQLTMNLRMNLKPMDITVGDTIQFTNSRFGWTNKTFEVIGWTFNPNPQSMGVDLTVQETSSTVYDWTPGVDEQTFEQDNTALPDPFYAPTPTLGASSVVSVTDGDSAVVYGTKFTWTDTNPYTEYYEVVWKAGASGEENSEFTKNKYFIVSPAEKGVTYYLKVRSITTLGVKSQFTTEDTEANSNRNTLYGESIITGSVNTPQVASNAINEVSSTTASRVNSGGVYVTSVFNTNYADARQSIDNGQFPTDFVTGPVISFSIPSTDVPDRLMLTINFTGYLCQLSQSTPTSTGGNYDLVLVDHSLAIQTLFNTSQADLIAHQSHDMYCLGGFPQQVIAASPAPRTRFYERGTDYNGGETMYVKFFLYFYESIANNFEVAYDTAYIECFLSEIKR